MSTTGIDIVLRMAERYIRQADRLNSASQTPFFAVQLASSAIGLIAAAKNMIAKGARTNVDLDSWTLAAREVLREARAMDKNVILVRWAEKHPTSKGARHNDSFREALWRETVKEVDYGIRGMFRLSKGLR